MRWNDEVLRRDDGVVSAKTSAARREAFFQALRETGNQTLAAERAKVSRSWVQLQRAGDPAFRAAVVAAVAEARETLSQRSASSAEHGEQSGRAPPEGWGFLDGEELVVKGTGGSDALAAGGRRGRRVQVARARLKQWTPRAEERFLATLTATCNVKAACAEVGLTAASAYGHRERWPAFARRWDEAIELGGLRLELALIDACGNPFSATELPLAAPLAIGPESGRIGDGFALTFDEGMHGLYMHQHRRAGIGRAPGQGRRKDVTVEAASKVIRIADALKRGAAIGEAERERDREEFARRRPRG